MEIFVFDDELEFYRSLSDDDLLVRVRIGDYKAVAVLLERLMEGA